MHEKLKQNKSGIAYFLPLKIEQYHVKHWTLQFQTYEEFEVGIQHFDWWQNSLAEFLVDALRLELDADMLSDFKLRYTGIPRCRVELIRGIYSVYRGANLTAEMKNEIAKYFDAAQSNTFLMTMRAIQVTTNALFNLF